MWYQFIKKKIVENYINKKVRQSILFSWHKHTNCSPAKTGNHLGAGLERRH